MKECDVAKDEKGAILRMTHKDAIDYCNTFNGSLHKDGKNTDLEARLPTGWGVTDETPVGKKVEKLDIKEAGGDLARLQGYLGGKNAYKQQVLPNLDALKSIGTWSSSTRLQRVYKNDNPSITFDQVQAWYFTNPGFASVPKDQDKYLRTVRCVIAKR